jgi:preprotein translocase subunit YajC
MGFVLLIPLLILMYVVLVRPQQQRMRRQRELISSVGVDDEVVTAGGIIGRIVEMEDDRVFLEVADDVVIEVLRIAITRRLDDEQFPQPTGGSISESTPEEEEEPVRDGSGEPSHGVPSDGVPSDGVEEQPAKPNPGEDTH